MGTENSTRIALTGASGFVGQHLGRVLQGHGFAPIALSRQDLAASPAALASRLAGVRGVINLAGAPILARWTPAYMQALTDSRVGLTRRLVEAIALMEEPPELLLSTSAVGYYAAGLRHSERSYTQASDFLGRLAEEWERAALAAEALRVRVVIFRLGVVLGPDGGALAQMLPPFRLGLGGTIGSGRQAFAWIHLHDLLAAYLAALANPNWQGIYNLTAPGTTTNAGLTSALGAALKRPTWFAVPEFILRLRFGDGAQVLTQGQEVVPERLLEAGFSFAYPTIEQAIAQCVSGPSPSPS